LAAAFEEAAQKDGTVALVALDLDHFKAYNDHFGHIAGDEALKNVGRALASVVTRQRDAACRIGGEEFAVILPFTDEEGAMTIAERIRAQILHMNIQHAPGYDKLTVSVGLAVARGGQIDSKTLYESRRQGALPGQAHRAQPHPALLARSRTKRRRKGPGRLMRAS
jgi:diguanylate cyclase (GGDEF)-like protein